MKIYNNGARTVVDGDYLVLREVEGKDISDIEVGRVDGDILAKAYEKAYDKLDIDLCCKYAKLKEEFLKNYGK